MQNNTPGQRPRTQRPQTHRPATRSPAPILCLLALLAAHPSPLPAADTKNILANIPMDVRHDGFNDAGYRTYLLIGKQATYMTTQQVDIRGGLDFTQYPGDGSAIVETRITAPSATVDFLENIKEPRIAGKETVRLVHADELDATGENWSYDHAQQKLIIKKNARIVYKAPLKDIIGHPAPAHGDASAPSETIITAETLELTQNEADNTTFAILSGNVVVTTTDDLRLTCARLEVTATRLRDKNPALTPLDKFQRLVATGDVRLTQNTRTITCGRADVLPREDRITLTQKPVLTDTALKITAYGDPLTLHRAERRIEGQNGRFILPPWTDTPANPKSKNPNPKSEDTIVTSKNYVMWETPDTLTHVTLDDDVTVAATDTRLTCDHLELIINPDDKSQPPPDTPTADQSKIQNPPKKMVAAPLHRLLATGNVHLTQAGREATAGQAEVLPHEDKIILTQNPALTDHATSTTATAEIFTLRQLERRLVAENNITITTPPIKDLSSGAPKTPAPSAPSDVNTVITANTLTMWTTPDEISHATLDSDVRLTATNLELTCNHLTLDADPDKPAPPPPPTTPATGAPPAPVIDPKLEAATSKILSMVATGLVRLKQPAREVSCERAEILPPQDRIILTGKPLIIDRAKEPLMITGKKLTLIRGQDNIVGEDIKVTPAPAHQ